MASDRGARESLGDYVNQAQSDEHSFYSSLVIEHIAAKNQKGAFESWHNRFKQSIEHHLGFIRLDLCPPFFCVDGVIKLYKIVHFNSHENLHDWVDSKEREQIFKGGQGIFRAYRFKSFTTRLEGLFSRKTITGSEQSSLGPPAWKQILAVVFGLYSILMVRLKLFPSNSILNEWSSSGAMLLAKLITSSILATVVMPFIVQFMGFWLYPAYRKSEWKADISGCIVVGLGLIFMAGIFDRI